MFLFKMQSIQRQVGDYAFMLLYCHLILWLVDFFRIAFQFDSLVYGTPLDILIIDLNFNERNISEHNISFVLKKRHFI